MAISSGHGAKRYASRRTVLCGSRRLSEDRRTVLRVDPESEREQVERLKAFKAGRDQEQAHRRLEELRAAARGYENLLVPIRQALMDSCSVGEVCGAMRDVFGEYQAES